MSLCQFLLSLTIMSLLLLLGNTAKAKDNSYYKNCLKQGNANAEISQLKNICLAKSAKIDKAKSIDDDFNQFKNKLLSLYNIQNEKDKAINFEQQLQQVRVKIENYQLTLSKIKALRLQADSNIAKKHLKIQKELENSKNLNNQISNNLHQIQEIINIDLKPHNIYSVSLSDINQGKEIIQKLTHSLKNADILSQKQIEKNLEKIYAAQLKEIEPYIAYQKFQINQAQAQLAQINHFIDDENKDPEIELVKRRLEIFKEITAKTKKQKPIDKKEDSRLKNIDQTLNNIDKKINKKKYIKKEDFALFNKEAAEIFANLTQDLKQINEKYHNQKLRKLNDRNLQEAKTIVEQLRESNRQITFFKNGLNSSVNHFKASANTEYKDINRLFDKAEEELFALYNQRLDSFEQIFRKKLKIKDLNKSLKNKTGNNLKTINHKLKDEQRLLKEAQSLNKKENEQLQIAENELKNSAKIIDNIRNYNDYNQKSLNALKALDNKLEIIENYLKAAAKMKKNNKETIALLSPVQESFTNNQQLISEFKSKLLADNLIQINKDLTQAHDNIDYAKYLRLAVLREFRYKENAQGLKKWRAFNEISDYNKSNGRNIILNDLFLPIKESANSLLFTDIRYQADNNSSNEYNLGLGFRKLFDDVIWGGYAYYDTRSSIYNNQFTQINLGLERLTEKYDLRFNLYLPDNEEYLIDDLTKAYVENNSLKVSYQSERALKGADLELGHKLPLGNSRIFFGGYYFQGANSDIGNYKFADSYAYKARFESKFFKDYLTIGAQSEYNQNSKFVTTGYARVRIPFGSPQVKRNLTFIEKRMTETIIRDIDIITSTPTAPEIVSSADGDIIMDINGIIPESVEIIDLSNTNPLAINNSENELDILTGEDTSDFSSEINMASGQTVLGGDSSLALTFTSAKGQQFHTTYRPNLQAAIINDGIDITFDIGFDIKNAHNSAIKGITINEGKITIRGLNSSTIYLQDLNISGIQNSAIIVNNNATGGNTINIDNVTIYMGKDINNNPLINPGISISSPYNTENPNIINISNINLTADTGGSEGLRLLGTKNIFNLSNINIESGKYTNDIVVSNDSIYYYLDN